MNRRRLASHQYPNTHPGPRRIQLVTLQAPASTTTPVTGIAPLTKRAGRANTSGDDRLPNCSRKRTKTAAITPAGRTTAAATAPPTANTARTAPRTPWTVATGTADPRTDATARVTPPRADTAPLTAPLTAPPTDTAPRTDTGTTPRPDDTATPRTPIAGTRPRRTDRGGPPTRNPTGRF